MEGTEIYRVNDIGTDASGECVFIHHSSVAHQNTGTVGDGRDDRRLSTGRVIETNSDRRGMQGDSVGRDDGDRTDLVQVGSKSHFVLKTVCHEPIGGDFEARITRSPALPVPKIHAGSNLDYPATGLEIAR